jgi:DNA polymerase-3 subunit alpha
MGKKKAEEMAQQRDRFVRGALERNYPQKKIEKIFDLMEQFAGYGFNKSHSAAYAYLAYITAYLKAHYAIEFMSALLTAETGNTSKVVKYMNECRDMGMQILPPDVNKSDKNFTPDGEAIRFGLCAIKNVGAGAVESIINARNEKGPFTSIYNFCERIDLSCVNRRVIESLIRAGALDSLNGLRSQFFAVIDSAMETGARAQRDKLSGQTGLFAMAFGGGAEDEPEPEHPLPILPDWTPTEKLNNEKELLGFYVTGHPLDAWMDKVCELAKHSSESLEGLEKGADIAICGIITGIQRRRNKEGKPWALFQLEDKVGATECMVFTTTYDQVLGMLAEDKPVFIRGMALPEEGAPTKISVKDIIPLEVVRVPMPSLISIKVRLGNNGNDKAQLLGTLFERKRGETAVRLRLERPKDFSVILDVTTRVRPDKEFRAEIERICGPECIEVLAT